jgi:hypothetical protein
VLLAEKCYFQRLGDDSREKPEAKKSRDTVPLKVVYIDKYGGQENEGL